MKQHYDDCKHAEILAQMDTCLPKDEAGNFIAERERSDVVHDLLAFLAEKMLADGRGDRVRGRKCRLRENADYQRR